MQTIADFIARGGVRHLELRSCGLLSRHMRTLSAAMQKSPVEFIDFSNDPGHKPNVIGEDGFTSLAEVLSAKNCVVRELRLLATGVAGSFFSAALRCMSADSNIIATLGLQAVTESWLFWLTTASRSTHLCRSSTSATTSWRPRRSSPWPAPSRAAACGSRASCSRARRCPATSRR